MDLTHYIMAFCLLDVVLYFVPNFRPNLSPYLVLSEGVLLFVSLLERTGSVTRIPSGTPVRSRTPFV